jgi:hypothetical protein
MCIRAVVGPRSKGLTRLAPTCPGLLPHWVESLDRQMDPGMEHLDAKPNELERYNYLIGESDRNETTSQIGCAAKDAASFDCRVNSRQNGAVAPRRELPTAVRLATCETRLPTSVARAMGNRDKGGIRTQCSRAAILH